MEAQGFHHQGKDRWWHQLLGRLMVNTMSTLRNIPSIFQSEENGFFRIGIKNLKNDDLKYIVSLGASYFSDMLVDLASYEINLRRSIGEKGSRITRSELENCI